MKGTHHHKAVLIKEFAVLACDLEIRIDQRAGGDAPGSSPDRPAVDPAQYEAPDFATLEDDSNVPF